MTSERLIREVEDSDFGRLSLWEEKSKGGPTGGPMREIVIHRWCGELGDLRLVIVAEDASDRAISALSEEARAVICGLATRGSELREQGAYALLDRARDWSGDASLTPERVMRALRLDAVHVYVGDPPGIDLWFDEIADVFGAQPILAYAHLDANGDIEAVNLVA